MIKEVLLGVECRAYDIKCENANFLVRVLDFTNNELHFLTNQNVYRLFTVLLQDEHIISHIECTSKVHWLCLNQAFILFRNNKVSRKYDNEHGI